MKMGELKTPVQTKRIGHIGWEVTQTQTDFLKNEGVVEQVTDKQHGKEKNENGRAENFSTDKKDCSCSATQPAVQGILKSGENEY